MQGIQVWRASLERPAGDVAALFKLLDAEERSRATRFINERDRRRFVVARGTLRVLLSDYTDAAPERVPLCVLGGGKPAVADGYGLHFNVSHCGELALFAFADCEVGVDVERVAPHREMDGVAAQFFSCDEAAAFRRLSGETQARFFCRTWVRKEAYLKATGEGFAINPASSSLDERYSVHDLPEMENHLAAVAVASIIGSDQIQIRNL